MTSPVSHSLTILLSQVISMNGLVSIGPLGVVFCFLGNVYKGISLQANSVRSTLDLFSFHSTTERDEKSKHGESEWRSHKSRLDGPQWPFMVTSVHPISFFRGPTSPFSPFTSVWLHDPGHGCLSNSASHSQLDSMIGPKGGAHDQRPSLRFYKLGLKREAHSFSVINLGYVSQEQPAATAPLCGEIPPEVGESRENPQRDWEWLQVPTHPAFPEYMNN